MAAACSTKEKSICVSTAGIERAQLYQSSEYELSTLDETISINYDSLHTFIFPHTLTDLPAAKPASVKIRRHLAQRRKVDTGYVDSIQLLQQLQQQKISHNKTPTQFSHFIACFIGLVMFVCLVIYRRLRR
ncbi:MAG: hypothetical protein J6J10_07880 [Alistipes sp.]|nr:hypothetical protein [Alistipes sp.]